VTKESAEEYCYSCCYKPMGKLSRSELYLTKDQKNLYRVYVTVKYGIANQEKLNSQIEINLIKKQNASLINSSLVTRKGLVEWAIISMVSDLWLKKEFVTIRPDVFSTNNYLRDNYIAREYGVYAEVVEIHVLKEQFIKRLK
jgi:hypothetical protein